MSRMVTCKSLKALELPEKLYAAGVASGFQPWPEAGGALRTDCKQGQDVNTAKFQKVFSRAPVCTTPGLRPHPKAAASREAWSNVIPQPHFVLRCD